MREGRLCASDLVNCENNTLYNIYQLIIVCHHHILGTEDGQTDWKTLANIITASLLGEVILFLLPYLVTYEYQPLHCLLGEIYTQ